MRAVVFVVAGLLGSAGKASLDARAFVAAVGAFTWFFLAAVAATDDDDDDDDDDMALVRISPLIVGRK